MSRVEAPLLCAVCDLPRFAAVHQEGDKGFHPYEQVEIRRQTVSILTACELVQVSRRTIYNWIATKKVEWVRTAGGSIRIYVDTLWRPGDMPVLAGGDRRGIGGKGSSAPGAKPGESPLAHGASAPEK